MFHMVETIAWIMPNLYGVPPCLAHTPAKKTRPTASSSTEGT